ncbi:MAG: hypothetical protein J6Z11_17225 [Candidatus Riflebacteria bacterium]|nr:hypothetical protein [Candidatus Riflebacteria bacterium]
MSENCPIKELIEFFKAAIKDANTPLPESLSLHARECKSCQNLLCSPKHWKAFVRANDLEGRPSQVEALGNTAPHNDVIHYSEGKSVGIEEGQVWKIDFNEDEDAVMGLVTDVASVKSDEFVRLVPIFVTPNSKDVDETSDILLKASQMPNSLPCMVEWWNDRPVEISYLKKCYGKIDESLLKLVKERIIKPVASVNISKSVFIFRETEKSKADLLSASVIRKIIAEEKAKSKVYSFSIVDIHELLSDDSANEDLAMASATNEISDWIDKFLKKDKARYYVLRLANNKEFTIASYDRKVFDLKITYENNEEKIFNSNQSGKLVLNEDIVKGFKDFEFIIKQ